MSIPQNFNVVEQRTISVTNNGSNTGIQFTVKAPAGVGTNDCLVMNTGPKGCQLLFAATLALAEAVAQSASAGGTPQYYVPSGAIMTLFKGANQFAGAVCDGSDTATLILHSGQGA